MREETKHRGNLVRLLRAELPRFVILRHEDKLTHAHPDLSITGNGRTSWWETKHAAPSYKRDANQELEMQRLESAGYARYIIWHTRTDGETFALIVRPRWIDSWATEREAVFSGFAYRSLVGFIKQVHS